MAGRNQADLVSASWRGGAEKAIHVIVAEVDVVRKSEGTLCECN